MSEYKKDRAGLERFLNDQVIPMDERKSNGGRIKDGANYGSWIRKNDPVLFDGLFDEWLNME